MLDYDAIIFDLGGVLLNIDFSLTQNEFKKLGMLKPEICFGKYSQKGFFDKLDKGEICENQLYNEIRNNINKDISNDDIKKAWNSMILDFPMDKIKMLKYFKDKCKIFLLSNTNKIHYKYYNSEIQKKGIKSIECLFDNTYLSFKYGMRKPDKEFFLKVINDNKLNPQKTLFIDDTHTHIETAKKLNIKTFLLEQNANINMSIFEEK